MIYIDRVRSYRRRYTQGRHCKNIWIKIPEDLYDRVDYAQADEDGYLVYLTPPFTYKGSDKIRAYSVKECVEKLKKAEVI